MFSKSQSTTIFFIVFFAAIALSVAATFFRYVVQHDFTIVVEASCLPESELCTERPCDPEYDECDADETPIYYKLYEQIGQEVPLCVPGDACTPATCDDGTLNCTPLPCEESSLGEGERCVGPNA